jgi:raffinose/stachyose/melibiose transport system substrate-binding protein
MGSLIRPAYAQSATIKLWDQFAAEPGQAAFQAILDAYAASSGNKIDRTIQPGATISQVAATALASGTGPDVIQYSVGKGNAGVLAEAGLIIPLDEYAAKYDWASRLSPIAILEAQLDGKLWGAPQESEVSCIFINKTLFDQHGLQVPTTHEEMVQLSKDANAKGVVPLAYGELDFYPSWWALSHVTSNAIGSKAAGDLVFNNVGSFNSPEIIDGIEKYWVQLREAGAFIPEVNALAAPDAQALFESGGALMFMSGTWAAGTLEQSMAGNVLDIAPMWSFDGKPRAYPTGSGSAMYISAASQVKDAAAEFLDYLYAEKPVVDMIEKASYISPRPVDVAALSLSDFQKRSVTSVSTGDGDPAVNQGVFVNHGRSGPEFLRTMTSGFQAMMAGDKTAAQQAADLQAAWEKDNA